MITASKLHASESLYPKECEDILAKIEKAAGDAADSVKKFEILTNSDKLCILTVGNNFAQDLEYTLNNLQRITIDNHKQGDDNKNLKEAVQLFSTFVHMLQLTFGNDLDKLREEIINVLQNLTNKLNPLMDIVRDHSTYTSKWEIVTILGYLYMAVEKVNLRIKWEHLDHKELQSALADIMKEKLVIIDKLKDSEDLVAKYCRVSHGAVRGIFQLLEEIYIDMYHYDDNIVALITDATNTIAGEIFGFDKALRSKNNITDLILQAQLCTRNVIPAIKKLLDILDDKNLQDPNGKIKDFILNAVVNGLSCSIQYTKYCGRILGN